MPQRRVLIIGSQCPPLGKLECLPGVARRLHELMVHPGPGECVGVEVSFGDHVPGLLLDPTTAEAKTAIKEAIRGAIRAGDALILAYIGHGELRGGAGGVFYLMPTDATEPADA